MTLLEAWRVVHPDFTSRNGYRWPFPGNWAYPRSGHREMTTGGTVPSFDGDGLCLAKTWRGAASGCIPAVVALLCEYDPADVLGEDDDKLRVRKAFVKDVYDPQMLIRVGFCAGADLREADLAGATLTEATLTEATLTGANLRRADLGGADLSGANMAGVNLTGANLRGADLREANLPMSFLYQADLYRANLRQADLMEADLTGANLIGADLTGANLYEADLDGADLTGANLSGVNLSAVDLGEWERGPDGYARRKP